MDHLLNFHAENQKIVQTTTYNILWVLHRECQKGSLHKNEYIIILLLEGFGNPQYIYIYIYHPKIVQFNTLSDRLFTTVVSIDRLCMGRANAGTDRGLNNKCRDMSHWLGCMVSY